MSYRTEVNGVQIFGNNEYYPEWLDFIRSKGIEVGEEGQYNGAITDFMGAMDVCERIVLRIDDERAAARAELERRIERNDAEVDDWIRRQATSLFDLSEIRRKIDKGPVNGYRTHLLDELCGLVDNGYLFIPMMLLRACQRDLELDLSHPSRIRAYRLKPKRVMHVHAG